MVRVLVVDDEPDMAALIERGLRDDGYDVITAHDGVSALAVGREPAIDIAIIDVMLPGMSGFELCRRLRETNAAAAILMLTARDAIDDRVRGLDAGADNYLTKPFAFAELAARLRALRRRDAVGSAQWIVAGMTIDLLRHELSVGGETRRLSRTELDLMRLLAESIGRPVERSRILDELWGRASHIDPNIVDQYVSYLRKKLRAVEAKAEIVSVRGVGFQLEERGE